MKLFKINHIVDVNDMRKIKVLFIINNASMFFCFFKTSKINITVSNKI